MHPKVCAPGGCVGATGRSPLRVRMMGNPPGCPYRCTIVELALEPRRGGPTSGNATEPAEDVR